MLDLDKELEELRESLNGEDTRAETIKTLIALIRYSLMDLRECEKKLSRFTNELITILREDV